MTEPNDTPEHQGDTPPEGTPLPEGTPQVDGGILDALVDAAPTGMARLGPDGRILHVNGHWAATTGQDPVDAHGHGWTSILDPDGRDEFLADLHRSLAEGAALRGRLRMITPSGDGRWLDLSTTPVRGADGEPDGALLSITDIKIGRAHG